MRIRPLFLLVALALSGALTTGCSDDDFSTGLPPDTVLDETSEEDLATTCEAITQEFASIWNGPGRSAICTALGVTLQSGLATCGEIASRCADEAVDIQTASCSDLDVTSFDACDTTIADVERCMQEYRDVVEAYDRGITCSDSIDDLGMTEIDDLFPPLCVTIIEECPSLGMLLDTEAVDPES